MNKPVGVIGSGSFGLTISKLVSENKDVLLYARSKEIVDKINATHRHMNVDLSPRIRATLSNRSWTRLRAYSLTLPMPWCRYPGMPAVCWISTVQGRWWNWGIERRRFSWIICPGLSRIDLKQDKRRLPSRLPVNKVNWTQRAQIQN